MSKKFYDYLSRKLILYFDSDEIRKGDKFFIKLDDKEQVNVLYDSLKDIAAHWEDEGTDLEVADFAYTHEKGEEYKTYELKFENINVVVAESSTIEDDYLATLRNQVIKQMGVWEDTILVVICNTLIDTVKDGMRDLQKGDMPLNIKTISRNLKNEIKDSDLTKSQKEVVNYYLNESERNYSETTLWDYEDVLGIIESGTVTPRDMNNLGFFPDDNLEGKNTNTIRSRLKDNARLYKKVEDITQYDDKMEELSKSFTDSMVSKLAKDDWGETQYKNVIDSYDKKKIGTKKLIYIENDEKYTKDYGLHYWEKPERDTEAGQRKRNIIVFNTKKADHAEFDFLFDKTVYKQFLHIKDKKLNVRTHGKKLNINMDIDSDKTSFAKITYKHQDMSKSTYVFNIAVVNCPEEFLKPIESDYSIDPSKKFIIINKNENTGPITVGDGENETIEVEENGQIIPMYDDSAITISEESRAWENKTLQFNVQFNGTYIPFEVKETVDKSTPINSLQIWKNKREYKDIINYNGIKAIQGVNSFYLEEDFKEFISFEEQIIDGKILSGEIIGGKIIPDDYRYSKRLEKAYYDILNHYKLKDNVPSLYKLDFELQGMYENFLNIFNEEIEEIETNSRLSDYETKRYLSKIGTFKKGSKIMVSSLSPINMAYQLEIINQCGNEKILSNILRRLSPENLIPYIFDDDERFYKPVNQETAHEWLIYEKNEKVSIGTTNAFIANVVHEKMTQFVKYFSYLFDATKSAPIKINIINIKEDEEIVKGVFGFIKDKINKNNPNNVIPVELNIYNGPEKSSFDGLFDCSNKEETEKKFKIKLNKEGVNHEDILRIVQNNITYYKHEAIPRTGFEYAHISFYRIGGEDEFINGVMDQIETGLSLNGLLSSTSVDNNKKEYYKGFGTRNLPEERNLLIRTAINSNELLENSQKDGENTYEKGKSIVTKSPSIKDSELEQLYEKSNWVTFIEPNFGLDYFDYKDDLIVIHYSEQYTPSSNYDVITVTNRHEQYRDIIKDFFEEKGMNISQKNVDNTIKLFNSINGEWLLRVISNNSTYEREKISIISAVKYSLAILDHPEIIWIPISLEEILRIAGTVKLPKREGIFSKSRTQGKHSDDLLLIGIREHEGKIKVYYYPIEVKEGINPSKTIKKGKEQVQNTYELLKDELGSEDEFFRFKNKFYRNFFMQIALSNEVKLTTNGIWEEKEMDRIRRIKDKLLNDEYEVSYELEKYIGIGAIVSFKKDNFRNFIREEDNINVIELSENETYKGIKIPMNVLYEEIQNDGTDLPSDDLFRNEALPPFNHEDVIGMDKAQEENDTLNHDNEMIVNGVDDTRIDSRDYETGASDGEIVDKEENPSIKTRENNGINSRNENEEYSNGDILPLDEIRALIGRSKPANHEIYIEYGQLNNKHMLVSGKSGYGKTYFLQCLMKEMAKQKIPTLIIDYSNSYTQEELEDEFTKDLADSIEEYAVYLEPFPLNPFRRHKISVSGKLVDEKDIAIAGRFKAIINKVYNMGPQQLSTINKVVRDGIRAYGSEMDMEKFETELADVGTPHSESALFKLDEFLSNDLFDSTSEFEWSVLDERSDKIIIIQLAGLSEDVQRIATEFILWDLYFYKLQHGSKEKPFNVVLDEAQNLSFDKDSPCNKILREGRKKGWSAWFATQSLSGELSLKENDALNNVDEKIYFHPTSNAKSIASEFSTDTQIRNEWTEKLNKLEKGECIVYGQIRDSDNNLLPHSPHIVKVSDLESRN